MKNIEISINKNKMEYNGIEYDLTLAIKKDTNTIFTEATNSHGDIFEKMYVKDSIGPERVRIFVSESNELLYGMIIYTINYKEGNNVRYACGNYYPFYTSKNGKSFMEPHPYQGSICW